MNPLLEVKDVCLSYHSLSGETAALSHISFHLMPEEFLAVVGPSGCGKSTLLNLICGLLHAESGTILMNGKLLNKDSARIGYMLQKDHLLEWRSIYRNVLLGLEIKGELTKDNLSYVDELLNQLNTAVISYASVCILQAGAFRILQKIFQKLCPLFGKAKSRLYYPAKRGGTTAFRQKGGEHHDT